jgi:hypothetical protein
MKITVGQLRNFKEHRLPNRISWSFIDDPDSAIADSEEVVVRADGSVRLVSTNEFLLHPAIVGPARYDWWRAWLRKEKYISGYM